MAFSPDDTKLAVRFASLGRDQRHKIVIVDVINTCRLTRSDSVTIDLDFDEWGPIGFHPSGGYICIGNRAWHLSSTPPISLTGNKLGTILQESFPLLRFNSDASPLPSISLGSPTRKVLYLPPDANVYCRAVYNGRIALGGMDSTRVIDFTHLATDEEKALLERVGVYNFAY